MSVNLYFSKINLPSKEDFPILKAVPMQPTSLTYQGGSNRLWLMMSKVQADQNGNEERVEPAFPFYSDDMGHSWDIYHHGFASNGKIENIKSAADGTVLATYYYSHKQFLLRLDEQPDNTLKFHEINALMDDNSWALGGDNLIYIYKEKHLGYPDYSMKYYLGDNQVILICDNVEGHRLYVTQMDVGSDGAFYAVVTGIPNFSSILCHVVKTAKGWVVQPTTANIPIERVIVASAAQVYAIPRQSEIPMYFYSGESKYLPVNLYDVAPSGTGTITDKIVQASAISPDKMCIITSSSKQVTIGTKKVTEFTNTAYIQVPGLN